MCFGKLNTWCVWKLNNSAFELNIWYLETWIICVYYLLNNWSACKTEYLACLKNSIIGMFDTLNSWSAWKTEYCRWQKTHRTTPSVTLWWLFSGYASPLASHKICQVVPVFSVVVNNRGLSHLYRWLGEGYISFPSVDMVLVCAEAITREAIECNWHVPAVASNALKLAKTMVQVECTVSLAIADMKWS